MLFIVLLFIFTVITVNHRVDSVIECSLREIIGNKDFGLINISLNFL